MKKLLVKAISVDLPADLEQLSDFCDGHLERHAIDLVNWNAYSYRPSVQFAIGYTPEELVIKYYVEEDGVKAVHLQSNEAVYQDSCVEFFVSPFSDGPYKNFEFNAIGTCLSQVGPTRSGRQFLDPATISSIRRWASLGEKSIEARKGKTKWELLVAIPHVLIFESVQPTLKGKIVRANFYKCGDLLNEQHYLSWNPIKTEKPDFHRPEFFGVLEFE